MKVRILPSAEQDLEDGADFYESQEPGVGVFFTDCLIADIDSLAFYAGIHEFYLGFYRTFAKRFPFAIYYKLVYDTAFVYAVLDCRRNTTVIDTVLKRFQQGTS